MTSEFNFNENYTDLIDLAREVSNETRIGYSSNKELIKKQFKTNVSYNVNSNENVVSNIYMRLSLIDYFYSTNMGRTFDSIYDMSKKINNIGDVEKQKEHFNKFLKNPMDKETYEDSIFSKQFGYRKKIKEKNGIHAQSLLSKYAYFLLDGDYPIYDDLAKKSMEQLISMKIKNIKSFYDQIKILKEELKDNSYDDLDRLLWLLGKVKKGSYSLIINRENYEKLYIGASEWFTEKMKSQNDSFKKSMKELSSSQINSVIAYYTFTEADIFKKMELLKLQEFLDKAKSIFENLLPQEKSVYLIIKENKKNSKSL